MRGAPDNVLLTPFSFSSSLSLPPSSLLLPSSPPPPYTLLPLARLFAGEDPHGQEIDARGHRGRRLRSSVGWAARHCLHLGQIHLESGSAPLRISRGVASQGQVARPGLGAPGRAQSDGRDDFGQVRAHHAALQGDVSWARADQDEAFCVSNAALASQEKSRVCSPTVLLFATVRTVGMAICHSCVVCR